jgi:hypothetical protein
VLTYGVAVTDVDVDDQRAQLRAHLVASRIAGDVATARENNLDHYMRMSERDPLYMLGLRPSGAWTYSDVFALMVERCGVMPDPGHTQGPDTISVDRTLERLDAMAARIGQAAERRESVFVATGHPVGLRPTHTAVAAALRHAGCTVITPASDWRHPDEETFGHHGVLGYLDDVGVLIDDRGRPRHTHSPLLMEAVLSHVEQAGEALPDLVVADHGWAGAAGQAGIDAVGFADCNDPALFVGEAEGIVSVCVPLDDNVAPSLYEPMTEYLLKTAGVSRNG